MVAHGLEIKPRPFHDKKNFLLNSLYNPFTLYIYYFFSITSIELLLIFIDHFCVFCGYIFGYLYLS